MSTDLRELAYHGPVELTPERLQAWAQWKDDYIANCMETWLAQDATPEQATHYGQCVRDEFASLDSEPWMPLGHAMAEKVAFLLDGDESVVKGRERVDFLVALRTLETASQDEHVAAVAYQLGTAVESAAQTVAGLQGRGHDEHNAGRTSLYRQFDADGMLLYIGIATDPSRRAEQHGYHSRWYRFVADTTVEWFTSRDAAESAERAAVQSEKPVFNQTYNKRNRDAAIDYLFRMVSA